MYIDIQKNEENKLYSTTFVIGEGDKFYLPRWDTPKEYIRVPKGVIIYYPFNSEHLHGHIDSYNVRIEYDFKKVRRIRYKVMLFVNILSAHHKLLYSYSYNSQSVLQCIVFLHNIFDTKKPRSSG